MPARNDMPVNETVFHLKWVELPEDYHEHFTNYKSRTAS